MNNYKLYAFYFSPTGGVKNILDIFLSEWNCDKTLIGLSDKADLSDITFNKDDICVFAVPSFSGRVPQFIIPIISGMDGAGAKTILVTGFGNRAFDDTLLELFNTLTESNFLCFAAMAAVTRHSVLPRYGKGRPDSKDITQIKEFSEKCRNAVNQEVNSITVSGNFPYRKYQSVPINPKVGKSCNGCGLCAKECPVNAIDPQRLNKTDKNKCISCLRCVAQCPSHARYINKFILKIAEIGMKKLCADRKENSFFIAQS